MRRALSFLLVVPLLAAGCLSGDPADAASLPDVLPELERSAARVTSVIDPDGGMGEPSLGVTPSGVLFTNGRDHGRAAGFDSGAVYRSRDAGVSWEPVGAPVAPFPNFDPDLVVDVDGNVWYDVLYLGCNAVAVSRDEGDSWSMNPAVCNGPVGDRQYVVPTKGGTAYLYYHQIPSFYQTAMKTTDYGETWLPTGPVEFPDHHLVVNGGSGWGGGGFWNAVTDTVFFTFTWFEGDEWMPAAALSRDGGLTWSLSTTPNAGGAQHGLSLVVGAADDEGNVYLAWAETDGDDSAVYLVASTDDGASWSGPLRVDTDARSNVFPAIAAGAGGKVALAYYEADVDGYPSDVGDEASWNVTLAWTADALAAAPVFEHARLSNETARVGVVCPDGTTCQGDREFLDYFSLKRLPDGRVGAVWTSTEAVDGKTVNVYAASEMVVLG